MNARALWQAVRAWYVGHSTRDRRIVLGVATAVLLSLVYVGAVEPLVDYRRRVAEEIAEGQDELERAARFLAAADALRAEREQLGRRLDEAKARLLPGDSGTLGAAALQERANAVAAAHGITVQSAQVMREEAADPFRKVAVRLTLSGELRPFVEFLSGLEHGPQQLTVPFVEVSRRGAVAAGRGPRALAAKVELSGYLLSAAQREEAGKAEAEEAAAEASGGDGAPLVPPVPAGPPAPTMLVPEGG
jgi:type II secretory pathway component PulM